MISGFVFVRWVFCSLVSSFFSGLLAYVARVLVTSMSSGLIDYLLWGFEARGP